jgi:pyruvate/2-oxoglutarate/acetoin dehydrogenase E1 component
VPALFHVEEVTQPQGHSTSGSHERYKSPERLEWEREWDCIRKFKEWILTNDLANEEEIEEIEMSVKNEVREAKTQAWTSYTTPIRQMAAQVLAELEKALPDSGKHSQALAEAIAELKANQEPLRRDVMKALGAGLDFASPRDKAALEDLRQQLATQQAASYNSHLMREGKGSAMLVEGVAPRYPAQPNSLNGYEILNHYFDELFAANPLVMAFGEDLGKIGDVNQGFAGLQQKHGDKRIFDTGIRETTIIGQGIGLALRGLRPIAEIQYLDYLLYGLQPLSDDVSSLQYRTFGQQHCPLIVRSRGHRLEGIWHSGSPMGMIINSLRGMHVCVPRNMVQAAGMYNTLLDSLDPALVIECLNGYRLKENLPMNLLEMRVPLGVPEVLKTGADITLVSYGSTLRIVMDAAQRLEKLDIDAEVIDVQTLLPFDIHHSLLASLKKTGRILFIDEDVPGGAAAYMYNQVMEQQGGYRWLDAAPRTLTAKAHRPAYGSDGDYFSKPNMEDVVSAVKQMMAE